MDTDINLLRREPAGRLRGMAGATLLALAVCNAGADDAPTRRSRAARCDASTLAQAFSRTELYFGLARPGGVVSEAEFQHFVDREVTPRFPAGLTLLDGNGQFRDARGQVLAERSKLLILLVPSRDRRANAKVEQIRAAYMRQFDQQSVLRADEPTCVSFTPAPRPATMTYLAPTSTLTSDPDSAELVERATTAHMALMQGDLATYQRLIETSDDHVLMSPFGGTPSRAASFSAERWASIARFFHGGRESTLDLVQAWRGEDMVVLAVIERTVAEIGGLPAQPWALRVTLVFKRKDDRWQLAHRHADPLVHGVSLQLAGALAAGLRQP